MSEVLVLMIWIKLNFPSAYLGEISPRQQAHGTWAHVNNKIEIADQGQQNIPQLTVQRPSAAVTDFWA